jgi:hypothetical protein
MGQVKGQFQPLLGQTIASIARVAIDTKGNLSPMMDTLLLSLKDGRNFELLVEQGHVRFEKLEADALFIGFELEPDEQLRRDPTDPVLPLPQTVESLTETWAGEENSQFLVAISLWDKNNAHIISICTEGDEAELLSLEALRQRMDDMVFSYGFLSHQLYSSPRQSQDLDILRSA